MSTLEPRADTPEPVLPHGTLTLEPPPGLPEDRDGTAWWMNLMPMGGAIGAIALVVTTGGADRTRSWVIGGMFLMTTVGFLLVQVDRGRRQKVAAEDESRTDYLHYLSEVRSTVRSVAREQRTALLWHFPDPSVLPALVRSDAAPTPASGLRTARHAGHPWYLHVRIGLTTWPLAVTLEPPSQAPVERTDPVTASALHSFLTTHRVQPDLPAVLALEEYDRVDVCGPRPEALAAARGCVVQAAAAHLPEDLRVAVLTHTPTDWDWIKWLPHARSSARCDAIGGLRLVCTDTHELADLVDLERHDGDAAGAGDPHLLVVLDTDRSDALPANRPGVTVLALPQTCTDLLRPRHLRLLLSEAAADRCPATAEQFGHAAWELSLDLVSADQAVAVAGHLWPTEGSSRSASGSDDLGVACGIAPLADLPEPFRPAPPVPSAALRVPVGRTDDGSYLWLDLKESALGGDGPHGLVVGATGSGKSEFLRTLVLGLALTHPADALNLVLVDFKGGATFAGLDALPHTAALITNLSNEVSLVDRMQDALGGELVRRQEVLRAAGGFASRLDLEHARQRDPTLPQMPSLVVVVDEFAELLSARPEFVDLFVAIGRVGRSLGVHLVLASQRLEEGRLRGLESHLSYRVGLRTFSAAESRAVLGVPDAHTLANRPGLGYLRTGADTLVRFTSTYVSGPVPRPTQSARPSPDQPVFLPLTLAPVPAPPGEELRQPWTPEPAQTLLERSVACLHDVEAAPHRIWLPPLATSDSLRVLLPDLTRTPEHGLHSPELRTRPLRIPVGVVDRPRHQRRDPYELDLSGAAGHLAVVGAPRSGKSAGLQTVLASLMCGHTPHEAQFYLLDLGGGALTRWARAPHVAGVGTRAEPDVVRRILAEVHGLLARRERWFRDHRVDSLEAYRALVRDGGGDGNGEVFVVVDGMAGLRENFEDLEPALQRLAGQGLAFGIHLLLSATRWTDVRAGLRDLLGSRIELKLGDALDSEVDRKLAAAVPGASPGRGLSRAGEQVLLAVPGGTHGALSLSAAEVPGALEAHLDETVDAWLGPRAPRLRLLPERIERSSIPATTAAQRNHPVLGIDENDLAPVVWDSQEHPHLLVFGEAGSGKTSVLRTLAAELATRKGPESVQIVLLDPRRTLLGEVPPGHLMDHAATAAAAEATVAALAHVLRDRLPGPEVTPRQLRDRSWWSGPEVHVLVDDHDLLASSQGSPLAPLVSLLPQARDVGLHVALARRSGGAARALYEPVIQALRDLSPAGLLLPGSPEEGPLLGNTKARPGVPGRAQWITRDGARTVQVVWTPPAP